LTFHGNQAILDIPIGELTRNEQEKVIEYLEGLNREEDEYSTPTEMTSSEKIKFLLDRDQIYILQGNFEIVTRTNQGIISLSRFDANGDIKFYSADMAPRVDQEFLRRAHQSTVQLFMKKWRNSVYQTGAKINLIIKTINNLQLYSTIIGAISSLTGLLTSTPRYMVLAIAPFALTMLLALIKRTLR